MVILLAFISLVCSDPDISVSIPDSVRTGELFSVEIRVVGEDISSIECTPQHSSGLRHLGSSNMHSFSSVNTPSGQRVTSEFLFLFTFSAITSGTHTIGPMNVLAYGIRLVEIPAYSVVSTDDASYPGTSTQQPNSPPDELLAWIEIEIDTIGRVYPGQTFSVDYYIYKTLRSIEIVDLFLHPSRYASSRMSEDSQELMWVKCKNGVWKTWLTTLEITPAFACSLELPVLEGRIGIPGGFTSRPVEQMISSQGAVIPVHPFPESGKPNNFNGLTREINFRIDKYMGCYSQDSEKCILVRVSGPGSSELNLLPELTISGPATLCAGQRQEYSDSKFVWQVLVEPTDSGTVIIGPDSIAWFDTVEEVYRQALIPSCTLSVHAPVTELIINIDFPESDGNSILPIILVSVTLLSIVLILLLRRHRGFRNTSGSIAEAQDPEELLTAMEYALSDMLTGSPSYMGSEELGNALDDRDVDSIRARRLLRHWKDLEMMLSGRGVSPEHLVRLKRTSTELIDELGVELSSRLP